MNLTEIAGKTEELRDAWGFVDQNQLQALCDLVTGLAETGLLPLLVTYTQELKEVERTAKNYLELTPLIENIYKPQEDKVLIRIRQLEHISAVQAFKATQTLLNDKLKEMAE